MSKCKEWLTQHQHCEDCITIQCWQMNELSVEMTPKATSDRKLKFIITNTLDNYY